MTESAQPDPNFSFFERLKGSLMATFRFLLLEDKLQDAEAIQATLTEGRIDYELRQVNTRAGFVTALETDRFDLILAAYSMPDLDGIAALKIACDRCPDAPFIFVSASLGEELAIEALKQGATDYVLKQRLGRLVPCVERALREAHERRDRQRAERMLIEQKQLLEGIASGQTLDDFLSAVCGAIAQLNPRVRASFLLTDSQGRTITPDFPPSFGQGLKDAQINDLCIGTCGEAVYRGHSVTCADIANDDRWSQDWRDLCVAHGVLACHSTPVLDADGQPLGALMLAFDEARLPTNWEYQLAAFGVQVASLAFERDRSSLALRESEEKYRTLFESIDEGFCICELLLDENGTPIDYRFLEVNPIFEAMTGLEQATGKTARELVPNLEVEWLETYGRMVLTGESVRFEQQSIAINRWFDVNAFCIGEPQSNQFAILFTNISDRKRAEQALRESEERSQLAIQIAQLGTWRYVLATNLVELDERMREIWDEEDTVLPLSHVIERIHPDDRAQVTSAIGAALDPMSAGEYEIDYRIVWKDGTERWISANGQATFAGKGALRQAVEFLGTAVDITDRKQAEAVLQESEEQSRNILESIMDAFFAIDENWRFTYVNQTAETLVNRTSDDLVGKVFWEEFPGMNDSAFEQMHRRVMRDRVAESLIEFYSDHDRWYEVRSYPAVNGVTMYFRNVTDQIQAEVALRQTSVELERQLQRFDAIATSVPDFIYTFDRSGRFTYTNQQLLNLLQKTSAEVLGKNFFDLEYPTDLATRLQNQIQQVIETRQPLKDETSFTSAFGNHVYEYVFVPLFDANGVVEAVAGVSRDITDLKRLLQQEQAAREAAERANRIKDEFLAVLSHELRSPLNPILGWTRLLQNGKLDAARQAEALKTIERNAKLQAQLVEDLLDISRVMQGKLTLTAAPVSLAFVISAALETVRLAAEARNVGITLDLSEEIAPVFGDATRLQQIVWNLLTNAIKFSPNGGRVTVELRQLDQLAQIRVIDTGKGINSQFLPHVFEYFRQEDGSTTRKFGGLGLGLAIVRQIVEMHGGTVKAESQGENQGAIFTVQLPVIQQASPATFELDQTSVNIENPLSNLQILVVDDDNDTREFQAFVLEQGGAKVTAVASGLEALQVLDQFIPDVLVSDVGMAEMNGYMLIQQIRSRPLDKGGQIPAIALTAYATEVDQQRAIQAGFQAHMTKPVEPEALVKAVSALHILKEPLH
ncbi:MAG: PAS domain S-box protein [Phormidium tanganyikae FI6-MK23]|nr:PAS domain S-box protein [Phormidium tanganyikae FI6-MK23]